jgi:hypothetical protein
VPARTASPLPRIERLAIEPFAKEIGVCGISKTEDAIADIIPPYGMAAFAERQFATEVPCDGIIFKQMVGRYCDLVRPLAIDPAAR